MRAMNTASPVPSAVEAPTDEPVKANVARAIELAGGPAKVARCLTPPVSTQTVCFWRDGRRQLKADYGAELEQLTNGQITRKDIWPVSWQRIWPELADPVTPDPGAPTPTHPATPAHQGV
jgi:DNA-binding transcriptional regulator YdaS (Cro superfamily)